jgi:hypothetical protein
MLAVTVTPSVIGASVSTLHHRQHLQQRSLHRWTGALTFFHNRPWLFQPRTTPMRVVLIARRELKQARIWVKVLRRELAETVAALRPRPQFVGHLQGWLCIHSREGAWNDEGAPYYGGLQMTYGWAGRVTDAALLSPGQQIAVAEAEAAEHGWSWSWMRSQWPNTFPPCAGLFA